MSKNKNIERKQQGMKVNKQRNLRANTLERYKMIVDEWFVNGFCGASAYQKFYKNVKRESTATVNFNVISKLPEVKQYILQKQEEAAKIIEVTKEGILKN